MTTDPFEAAFSEAVTLRLGFLRHRGFETKQNAEGAFCFDSPKTRVRTDIEKRRVGLSVGPHPSTLKAGAPTPGISVVWLAELHGERTEASLGIVNSPAEVYVAVEQMADLLRRHGGALLDGDFTELPAAEAFATEALKRKHGWLK